MAESVLRINYRTDTLDLTTLVLKYVKNMCHKTGKLNGLGCEHAPNYF